ncbi:DUF6941 family protein [Chloroflexota bacterium]
MIIANSFSVGTNGQMDIKGISNEVRAKKPGYRATFIVLAKVTNEDQDIGTEIELTLQIQRKGKESVASLSQLYKAGGLGEQAKSTPFVYFDIKGLPFRKTGSYSFDISIDGEFKGREWLTISNIGDEK